MAASSTKRTAQQVLADFRKQEILDAAFGLTVESGRHALTMKRVAERAGVAKGTVYLYFKDKEELIRGLMNKLADAISESMVGILRSNEPFAVKLHKLLEIARQKSSEYRELMILLHRTFGDFDEIDESGRSNYEDVFEVLIDELEKERSRGGITTQARAENIAYAYLSMLKGTVLSQVNYQKQFEEAGFDDRQIVDIFVRGIGLQTLDT